MARSPSDGSRQTICMWYSCSELLRDEEDLSYGLLNARSSGLSLRELFPKKLHELGVFDRVSEERAPQFYRHKLESLLQEISERERTKLVVFLDDFDMVRDAESIGNFIKRMDFVRFVIIGNTFRSLSLFENKSLQRRLRRVELQPLSQHDVNSWLDFIERSSGNALTFSRDFRNMIYKESRGVPWILQRLSYETATLAAQSQLTDHVVVDSESLSAIALGLVTRGELPPPNRLRELREMLGLTRADLARLSAVSDKTIARVESSQRGIRDVTYRRILNGLNMGRNRRGLASLSFDSLFKENE